MFKPRTYNIISGSFTVFRKRNLCWQERKKVKLVTIALASTLSPSPELQDCFQAFQILRDKYWGIAVNFLFQVIFNFSFVLYSSAYITIPKNNVNLKID